MIQGRDVIQLVGLMLGSGLVATYFSGDRNAPIPPPFPQSAIVSGTPSSESVVTRRLETPPIFLSSQDRRKRQLSVELTNDTQAEIVFLEPRSSCGCTIARLDPVRVLPDQSTQMQLEVDVTRLVGAKTISITIPTKNGKTWAVSLDIPAYPQVGFERQETLLGDLKSGRPFTTSCFLDFYGPDRESLARFKSVTASTHEVQSAFQSEMIQEIRTGVFRRRVELQFTTTTDQEIGQRRAELVATAGDGIDARHTLIWRVKSLFDVSPARIFVSKAAPGAPAGPQESVVVVRHLDNMEFTMKPIGTLPDGISLIDTNQLPASEQSLTFAIDQSAIQAKSFFRIQLESSIAAQMALEIPVIIVPGVSRADGPSSGLAPSNGP